MQASKKPRDVRAAAARAARRALASINPSNAHPQTQSPLFSTLPAEIRNFIFHHVVSQRVDFSRTNPPNATKYWPGHQHRTTIDLTLLLTCRLIYYETRYIALQSATHHERTFGSWPDHEAGYLFHLSAQQCAHLYHLHHSMSLIGGYRYFERFTELEYMQWKKITVTLRADLWPDYVPEYPISEVNPSDRIKRIILPQSCQEFTVEIDTQEDFTRQIVWLRSLANNLMQIDMNKRDGTKLRFHKEDTAEFRWTGMDYTARRPSFIHTEGTMPELVKYWLLRLCWRSGVPKREYESYDRVHCLSSALLEEISPKKN
ncbi:hypothetical protein P154DRAFT_516584 [Amniculicola lignicola CBS 123094]|uniref:Uncharacterized protein n=1 Tax=Amniculicola lignicola CBS 123094 TaxID=1392246 RepID=A0A6A5X4I5_9PLEO|nr:hypothetical protein P154DRAFT_516584 [Amniculicola lignicola CBS 123094]